LKALDGKTHPRAHDRYKFRPRVAVALPSDSHELHVGGSRVRGGTSSAHARDPGRNIMFSRTASQRSIATKVKATSRNRRGQDGVVEPDNRIVFAVLAIGMLVGALLTTPAKPAKPVDFTTQAKAN
jgi:hypothetical protein